MMQKLNDPKFRNALTALVMAALAVQGYASDHTIADKVASVVVDLGIIFGVWSTSARQK